MDKDLINFEANFSVLDRYGTYVTKEEFITNPAIGRDQQIKELILVLLTPEKSAILIGKPGIGKTAIVEGLAYRIQQNDVPEALRGFEIINIKTASLLGTMPSGESKVQKMIDELKTKEKLILFIDEIHMLIGATDSSSLDFANIFKEGLGRGSIKVIGATTTEEYERYILRDKAFTRRFQKIEVPEPSRDETIQIMMGTLPKFEKQTGRKMKYTSFIQQRIMSFLVDITSEYKRVFALGSRYPDVCLTLLKQAFSYTVYDNRPYMDIFDIRKAIENSKNIYPDVIKKELPNFDKMFNDIILEEKGEKPVEEWRKDNAPTRSELEGQESKSMGDNTSAANIISSNVKKVERNKGNIIGLSTDVTSTLQDVPEFVDTTDAKENRKLPANMRKKKFARIGSTDVSVGLKEKLNRGKNVSKIDDILLSGNIDVIKRQENTGPMMPTSYVITDELKQGVDDSYLLGRPILSTLDMQGKQVEENETYNRKRNKNEGRNMWNDGNRPNRQDISTQNFDKYNNFFHQDSPYQNSGFNNGPMNQNMSEEEMENAKRMDMLMGKGNSDNGPLGNNQNMNGPMPGNPQGFNPGMPPMSGNGGMGPMPGNPQGFNPGMPPMLGNGGMGPMPGNQQGFNPGMPPMSGNGGMGPMPGNQQGFNPGMPPMPGNGGMRPMPGNQQGFNPGMPPMSGPGPTGPSQNSFLNPPSNSNNSASESLFGAPMYEEKKDNQLDQIPDIYGPNNFSNNSMNQNSSMNNGFFGVNNNNGNNQGGFFLQGNNPTPKSSVESLFGAPMYTEELQDSPKNLIDSSDIVGNLISEDMRIKNGKIVDEFPTFDKLNNLSNIQSVIKDVRSESNNFNNNQNQNPSNSFLDMSNNNSQNNFMNQGNNQSFLNMNNNMNNSNNMFGQPQNNATPFQDNILASVHKQNDNQNTNTSTNPSTSGDFVNLSDLNSGKVKEENMNKFMGPPEEKPVPTVDLNLENNNNQENNYYDDFFE